MNSIIPGLIDDLGLHCLIRIPYQYLPTAISVSKVWETHILSPEFRRLRKSAGLTRPVVVVAQTKAADRVSNSGQGEKESASRPVYGLNIYDPVSGTWAELPGIPWVSDGLPLFSGIVGTGSDLVVMGGWDPVTFRASNCVYIYNFLLGQWRRGSDMPGVRRSLFGFASDHDRTVMIAGGHDDNKNALNSALLYDVAENKWVPLPDMAKERDECKVIFHRGMFHVISGYSTDNQGAFERTAEAFDCASWQWGPVIEEFMEKSASPRSSVAGLDGKLYSCIGRQNSDMAVQNGEKWQILAKIPADVRSSQWVTAYSGDKLLVIGAPEIGESHEACMIDLKSCKWTKIEMPKEFCGHVQAGCVMEL